jgi:hypothetical protein
VLEPTTDIIVPIISSYHHIIISSYHHIIISSHHHIITSSYHHIIISSHHHIITSSHQSLPPSPLPPKKIASVPRGLAEDPDALFRQPVIQQGMHSSKATLTDTDMLAGTHARPPHEGMNLNDEFSARSDSPSRSPSASASAPEVLTYDEFVRRVSGYLGDGDSREDVCLSDGLIVHIDGLNDSIYFDLINSLTEARSRLELLCGSVCKTPTSDCNAHMASPKVATARSSTKGSTSPMSSSAGAAGKRASRPKGTAFEGTNLLLYACMQNN